MKLTIELNDNDLRKAISEQIGATVSSIANEMIVSRVTEVLNARLGRVTDLSVETAIRDAAREAVTKVINKGYNDAVVRGALADAAERVIKAR